MRTKALTLVAALGAASIMALQAQVYSVNVVGYVNVTVPAGKLACLAVPLDPGSANKLSDLLKNVPDGTIVYKFDASTGKFVSASYLQLLNMWTPDLTLSPGEGFFVRNPSSTDITITFVGEVLQGQLTVPLVKGFNLVGSKVPQQGKVATDLKLPVADQEIVYTFNVTTQKYDSATYMQLGNLSMWTPEEPIIDVAQGFWVLKQSPANWTREFTVQ